MYEYCLASCEKGLVQNQLKMAPVERIKLCVSGINFKNSSQLVSL